MEARNLTQKDPWEVLGPKGMASEVFHGKRSIGKTQARNGSFLPRKRRSVHLEGARGPWHVARGRPLPASRGMGYRRHGFWVRGLRTHGQHLVTKIGSRGCVRRISTFPHISTVSSNRRHPPNSLQPLDFRDAHSNPPLSIRMNRLNLINS